jgi:hypothetical protein
VLKKGAMMVERERGGERGMGEEGRQRTTAHRRAHYAGKSFPFHVIHQATHLLRTSTVCLADKRDRREGACNLKKVKWNKYVQCIFLIACYKLGCRFGV